MKFSTTSPSDIGTVQFVGAALGYRSTTSSAVPGESTTDVTSSGSASNAMKDYTSAGSGTSIVDPFSRPSEK